MTDMAQFLSVIVQAGAFVSAFAAIAAGIIMARVTKKFGTGILASGFRTISFGIILIAIGIVFDAAQVYFDSIDNPHIMTIIIGLREIFFVAGTYIIVIGSKRTGDKLETLTK